MRFEWDDSKADTNLRKHGVSFPAAISAFSDSEAIEFVDESHSSARETRYALIGVCALGLVYVVFTEVEPGVMRIIHARRADRRMLKIYESKQ